MPFCLAFPWLVSVKTDNTPLAQLVLGERDPVSVLNVGNLMKDVILPAS